VGHHRAEGDGVAYLPVEARRAAQVCEEDGQTADVYLVAGAQRLGGEEVAEELQRRDLGRGRRLPAPRRALDDEELFGVGVVLQSDGGARREPRLFDVLVCAARA
jgi:hypothetical protein